MNTEWLKSKKWILLVAVIVVGALIAVTLMRRQKTQTEVIAAKRGPIVEAVYGLGTVVSEQIFEFKPGTTTTLIQRHVRQGDSVSKGAALVTIQDGGVVRAPFAGVVTLLPYHDRETVFPQMSIVRVENLARTYVEVALEQRGALRVQPKQTVRMSFESYRNQVFSGHVINQYPSQGQFLVRVEPDASLPKQILPGMTVDVAIEVDKRENALLVPARAINFGRIQVLNKDGKKEMREVKVGLSDGEWTEIPETTLAEGERIVVPKVVGSDEAARAATP